MTVYGKENFFSRAASKNDTTHRERGNTDNRLNWTDEGELFQGAFQLITKGPRLYGDQTEIKMGGKLTGNDWTENDWTIN